MWHVLGEEELQKLKSQPGINWLAARTKGLALLTPESDKPTDAQTITLALDGIWCASCTLLIEHVVAQTPGVFAAKVDFSTSTAEIAYDRESVTKETLCESIAKLGYQAIPKEDASSMEQRADVILLRRFSVAALLSLLMMMLSVPIWTGYLPLLPSGVRIALTYSLWFLTTPVIFWSGWPFLRGAWSSLRHLVPTMDLLIAIGSLSAYFYSVINVLQKGQFVYFDTASLLVSFLLFSRTLEAQTKRKASRVVSLLGQLAPKEARVLLGDQPTLTEIANVRVGDFVRVEIGETFPVDGTVIAGHSSVDESMLTGESMWVDKQIKDTVYAGTKNLTGTLTVQATRIVDTLLNQTTHFVQSTEMNSLHYKRLADRILQIFVPLVILVATLTIVGSLWLAHLSLGIALLRGVAVLVIGCPCALSVATPLAVLGGVRRLHEYGILLRKHEAFEHAANIDTLILDKTGTVTLGSVTVKETVFVMEESLALKLALSAEFPSDHPISKAIVQYAVQMGLSPFPAKDFELVPGFGVRAKVLHYTVSVGADTSEVRSPLIEAKVEKWRNLGYSIAYLYIDGQPMGAFAFADAVRKEAYDAISRLKQAQVRVVIASGDHAQAVAAVAHAVGIEEWHANLRPTEKAELVAQLQSSGQHVAFLGDGVNDAPALIKADLGMAMGNGSDLAIQAGHFVLAKPDLRGIPDLFELGKKVMGTIRFNLGWAIIYNGIALIIAAFGFASPAIAALAMLLSSAFVLGNSLRVFGFSPQRYVAGGFAVVGTLAVLGVLSWFAL
ncbi:heavy metal translocating P-type ATPase [Sulfoacidibacillus thermotolerans]|uniref:heavy metal translocating P-type ATPase n=1 Tax=Sulfoacidibacillus thermotolerans TaxID=1765684 RepID=UPI0015E7FA63|nr:cation-translocating P-type ATPase [Sulfoacidibacillus thermotolerans]